jgi:hypothetical protein
MRTLAPGLLFLAACSSGHEYRQPATVTALGAEGRLETWDAVAVEGGHVHARKGALCPSLLTAALPDPSPAPGDPRTAETRAQVLQRIEAFVAFTDGKPFGGPGRLALGLRRYPPGTDRPSEAVFLEMPALGPEEQQRTFEPPELRGEHLRPVPETEGALDRGYVRARRTASDRMEFEVFAVFRPVRKGAAGPLQVVTRVEARVER